MSRTEIAVKLYEIQGKKCFICGRPIDLNSGDWQIDHIVPKTAGGKDELNNFALHMKSAIKRNWTQISALLDACLSMKR